MVQNSIALAEVLSRDVAIQWFEAVAVLQSVCGQLIAADAGAGAFPTPADILLQADGSIEVRRTVSVGDAVPAAARLLAELRPDDLPVQLRLIVTRVAAGDPEYPMLADFSKALAYFERADSQQIVRQLFQRAALAPARATLAPPPPTQHAENKPPAPTRQPRKRSHAVPMVLAIAFAAAATAVVYLVGFGPESGGLGTALNAVGETVRAGLRAAPASAAEPLEKGEAGKGPSAASTPAAAVRPAAQRTRTSALPTLPYRPLLPRPALDPSNLAFPVPAEVFHSAAIVVTAAAPSAIDGRMGAGGDPIYSASDADVQPPYPVYPKLPSAQPGAPLRTDRTIVDLVISSSGSVERLKVRTPPRNIHEFMLLSAAKAWQFEPATLDGVPVRFRHSVVLTLNN